MEPSAAHNPSSGTREGTELEAQTLITQQQQLCPGYTPEIRIIRVLYPAPKERWVSHSNTSF